MITRRALGAQPVVVTLIIGGVRREQQLGDETLAWLAPAHLAAGLVGRTRPPDIDAVAIEIEQ
jgi:hypothetical protein